ncbi:ArsR/SmtB family transcription factor [Ahrensia sp. 13_GOM-1096m]|uniref:ArsR/SmtB family transcription factor n=1 Tax=Ahrensia TaxID=152180 RepID=UPI003528C833
MESAMFQIDPYVDCLKSIAEPSRLRILRLLADGDLTVSDLTAILGQSQPRVSRHLKLLIDAQLINRWQEGSWALFRLVSSGTKADLVHSLLAAIEPTDPVVQRDLERLESVKQKRRAAAAEYFAKNAASWDKLRMLHAADGDVEKALLEITGRGPFNNMLDIGTGTGRMLELFAPYYRSAVGIDASREMLGVARSNLEAAELSNVEVRLGDIYNMPVERNAYDLIVIHQVLHYLDDPAAAMREAMRSLSPSGRLVVVDFAPHEMEFLRQEHQHQRLGFETKAIEGWFKEAGLQSIASKAIKSSGTNDGNPLTVMIWAAEDKRIEIADTAHVEKLA